MTEKEKWKDPVSIILPAYNEENCILSSIKTLLTFCKDIFDDFEIICVDDGSTDKTGSLIREISHDHCVRALHLPENRGKGHAVKHGMRRARGRFRFFTDADLPYSLNAFSTAMECFNTRGCDLVTGARDLPDS